MLSFLIENIEDTSNPSIADNKAMISLAMSHNQFF